MPKHRDDKPEMRDGFEVLTYTAAEVIDALQPRFKHAGTPPALSFGMEADDNGIPQHVIYISRSYNLG